jgi:Sec-independent protein translocase protein TatA
LLAIIVIVLLVLLLLGGDRLAMLGKGLGESAKAFKKTVRGPDSEPKREPISRRVIVVSAEPLPDKEPPPRTPPSPGSDPREGS